MFLPSSLNTQRPHGNAFPAAKRSGFSGTQDGAWRLACAARSARYSRSKSLVISCKGKKAKTRHRSRLLRRLRHVQQQSETGETVEFFGNYNQHIREMIFKVVREGGIGEPSLSGKGRIAVTVEKSPAHKKKDPKIKLKELIRIDEEIKGGMERYLASQVESFLEEQNERVVMNERFLAPSSSLNKVLKKLTGGGVIVIREQENCLVLEKTGVGEGEVAEEDTGDLEDESEVEDEPEAEDESEVDDEPEAPEKPQASEKTKASQKTKVSGKAKTPKPKKKKGGQAKSPKRKGFEDPSPGDFVTVLEQVEKRLVDAGTCDLACSYLPDATVRNLMSVLRIVGWKCSSNGNGDVVIEGTWDGIREEDLLDKDLIRRLDELCSALCEGIHTHMNGMIASVCKPGMSAELQWDLARFPASIDWQWRTINRLVKSHRGASVSTQMNGTVVTLKRSGGPGEPESLPAFHNLATMDYQGDVVYARSSEEVDQALVELEKANPAVVGLDVEYMSPMEVGLLQICYRQGRKQFASGRGYRCLLLHVCHSGVTKKLKQLLVRKGILKVGVGMGNDIASLKSLTKTDVCEVQDMGVAARTHCGCPPKRSLQNLCASYLGVHLTKSIQNPWKRAESWGTVKLSEARKTYAILDAFAALRLYEVVENMVFAD